MSVRTDKQGTLIDAGHDVQKQVECLGLTFDSEEARREHFTEILREKLRDPEFRKIEGFPIGTDEEILALSNPPYYTACPNPFIKDYVELYGRAYDSAAEYNREPLAIDITEGKGDPVYDAHPYHTKVPPKALLRLLLHYTNPGALVLDAFSGSGMLGVAAALCENDSYVEPARREKAGRRYAILSDLSTLAGFIGHVNSCPAADAAAFVNTSEALILKCKEELGWMYRTKHNKAQQGGGVSGEILYTIWSEFYRCSNCSVEVRAWDVMLDRAGGQLLKEFHCPSCDALLRKESLERVTENYFDSLLNQITRRNKSEPVWIHYKVGNKRFEKAPGEEDLATLERIDHLPFPASAAGTKMNFRDAPWGDFYRAGYHAGVTHVHHFYTKRNFLTLLAMRDKCLSSELPQQMLYVLTGFADNHASKRNRYIIDQHHPSGTTCGPLPNSLYVPDLQCEVNPFETWKKTAKKQAKAFAVPRPSCTISTTEASRLSGVPGGIVDYIFIDPPFGQNILYSESSFCWEYFLGVHTNAKPEAIVSKVQRKDVAVYQGLIRDIFAECFRVLKPQRWMTIEFSNRSNVIWNAISEAIQSCGFVIADVRIFDKKQGTIRQDMGQSVKKDLIISAYKPDSELEERFKLKAGTEDGVWDFVRTHLHQLPNFALRDGQLEVIAERQNHMLFDRMVAFHVQRGVTVALSASEFYAGLVRRFPERDGMYFLPEQVAEYDKKRMSVGEVLQLELFVSDEASAIRWLKQHLTKRPQSFQELHPQFLKETSAWQRYERPLELSDLLEQNFLRYDGTEDVPSQIHKYLSTNFKELRNLSKDNPALQAKAKNRWYVPDPNKATDLEKLRERALLKEFAEYRESKQKRLKVFRLEAVRAGFQRAWQQRDYPTIIEVAHKIPEEVLQEDAKLLMWYDQALTRTGIAG